MICCECKGPMSWQSDFTCEDVKDCKCDKGIVAIYYCSDCEVMGESTVGCDFDNGEVFLEDIEDE